MCKFIKSFINNNHNYTQINLLYRKNLKKLPVYVDKGKTNVVALLNNGAGRSLIRKDVINIVMQQFSKLLNPIIFL